MIPSNPNCLLANAQPERRKAVLEVLERCRFPREDWLADGLEKLFPAWNPAELEGPEARRQNGEVESLLSAATGRWQAEPIQGRDVALYNLLMMARHAFALEVGPLVDATRDHVDFTTALASPQVHCHGSLVDQARWLLSQKLISPSSINWTRLEKLAATYPLLSQPFDAYKSDRNDPHSPVFWLAVSPSATWVEFVAMVRAVDDLAKLAVLWRGYFAACLARRELHGYKNPPDFRDTEKLMHLTLIDYLGAQVANIPAEVASDVTATWLLACSHLYWSTPSLEMPLKELAIEKAKRELGSIRPLLRAAKDDPGSASLFERRKEVFGYCAEIVFEFCPLWEAARRLLLAFRDCSVPAVTSDLRYWSNDALAEVAPEPWSDIPATLVHCLHFYSRKEQEHDEDLVNLRTQFARFCLDRLKPNPKTGAPYEPDIHWRRGYVEAARKLCVNPDGRGHRVLHQVAHHESDPTLKRLAKRAYDVMRKGPRLPGGLSPRRVVFQAFLELRRAHRLALGLEVDWTRATTTTSEQEARRTTEPDKEVNSQ